MGVADANLTLLGNAIRTFREQAQPKRISQFRLAALMQWEGTAPIIEIEKGRRRPRPETLNALGEALQLSPADIAWLHGLAGYRDITVMPPVEQVKRVLRTIEPEIAHRRYPVYVLDYQFRFWMMNTAGAFQGGSLDLSRHVVERGLDAFRLVFDSYLPFRGGPSDAEVYEREIVFRFKAYNLYRRHEPFYLSLPERMKGHLAPHDYAHFVQCWNAVNVQMQDVFPINPQLSVRVGSAVLTFEIHMVELLHLDRLLFLVYYEPKDDGSGNRARCEAYFGQQGRDQHACLRVWDPPGDGPPSFDE
jgi:hypothetical protein